MRSVQVVPHDPVWQSRYTRERDRLLPQFPGLAPRLHHIGSTAIRGIHAKPIIDMLLEVSDVAALDRLGEAFRLLGYEALGEYGIPGRRYFRRLDGAGNRLFHLHAYSVGDPHVSRHLAFRDYLRLHPEAARTYSDLKRSLARQYATDIEAYMDGKDGLIKELEALALDWQAARQPPPR